MPLRVLAILFGLLLPDPLQAQDTPSPLTRIAFGSCADEEKPQPIWNAVLAYQPQFFLFAGDNVYGDVRQGREVPDGELIQSLQESYVQAAQVSGMARLRSTIPHLATWDDHDYGKNDAGAEFAGRHEAQRLFLQFWNVPPSDVRHQREGIYHSQTFGPNGQRVQVIRLDHTGRAASQERVDPPCRHRGPAARMPHQRGGSQHQKPSQVSVALLGDVSQPHLAASPALAWHQPDRGRQVSA